MLALGPHHVVLALGLHHTRWEYVFETSGFDAFGLDPCWVFLTHSLPVDA
jgi:hypothetical protein